MQGYRVTGLQGFRTGIVNKAKSREPGQSEQSAVTRNQKPETRDQSTVGSNKKGSKVARQEGETGTRAESQEQRAES